MRTLARAYLILIASVAVILFLITMGREYGLYVPLMMIGMLAFLYSIILAFQKAGGT